MTSSPPIASEPSDTAREQTYLDLLHSRVDTLRAELTRELAAALREHARTAQGQLERGATVDRLGRRLAALDAAENGLCFGRLDVSDGSRLYLGRIGIRGLRPEDDPLMLDWRAPAARPFYTATAAAPQGVTLRRYLHTRARTVLRVDDEWLDSAGSVPGDVQLSGEAALLAALRADRTGRMRDAVATLQAEQDRIIRAPHAGVLVVQGGPGTGKTVVALHRAAYLLYSDRRLEDRGVLVLGPNPVFLGYIGQVLPGLGETSVLLSSVGELFPGVRAVREEPGPVAEIKGRAVMADVLAAAVRARQAVTDGPVDVLIGGEQLRLEPALLAGAVARARDTALPHNLARPVFCQAVIDELARRLARVIADIEARFEHELAADVDFAAVDRAAADDVIGVFGEEAQLLDMEAAARVELAERVEFWLDALPRDPVVRRLLEALWPHLTPQELLADLFADPDRLAGAAPQLSGPERELLHRPPGGDWTLSDVPLLDEASELLGAIAGPGPDHEAAERAMELAYAQGVLDIARGSRTGEDEDADGAERLGAADLLDAERLAARHKEADLRTTAERAAADRTWVFGHVIVDEAQEVSPMVWRLLVRRCPTRSFTVVGDAAQTGEAAGSTSWSQALEPFFGTRWRLEQLTVNYRTPAAVMAAADKVLAAIDPALRPAKAVRAGDAAPWREQVPSSGLPSRLAEVVAAEAKRAGDGRVAVLVPQADLERLAEAVRAEVPDTSWGPDPDLERRVVVLSVRQAKGLEFDSVVLVDPQAVLDASPRGLNDLYVALTRSSRRLAVLHPGPVPAVLEDLPEGGN
ncbi:HelD family protein [Streptomyces sp. NBC_00073]|uniref:HelD family protein n=1 Tax=Streptomyces sp. NBC_00073 TaxID=2975640 RepID=UPI00324A557A